MLFTGTAGWGLRAPPLGVKGGAVGPTRAFPTAYSRCFILGKCGEVEKKGRGRKVQGGDWSYPACLAESTLKERVEGHGVFPTTGQTAICKKDRDAACGNDSPKISC